MKKLTFVLTLLAVALCSCKDELIASADAGDPVFSDEVYDSVLVLDSVVGSKSEPEAERHPISFDVDVEDYIESEM